MDKSPTTELKNPYPNFWGTTPEEEYYTQHGIKSTNSFYTTLTTNQTLFTRSWLPLSTPVRGIVCMIHGYGNDISWTFQATPIFLAQNGFACYALDLPGHGRSSGLKAFVPKLDPVVNDCIEYFSSVISLQTSQDLPVFLSGESMGGAICLLITLRANGMFRGVVLLAPLCKISDTVRPKWPIPEVLTFVGRFLPTLAIVPSPDLLDKGIKVPEKRSIAVLNPVRYFGKPRLGTVVELLRVTDYLSANLKDVAVPFIVLHGSSDVVTDPNVSRTLYQEARSDDKTIKIYEGMFHSLLFGETDENIAVVRGDILAWLSDRCN